MLPFPLDFVRGAVYDEARREWTFRYSSGSGNASTESASIFTDFEVRVTFPGRVLSASGSGRIEGNTVTWSDPKDMYLKEGLRATASAEIGRAHV